MIRTESLTKYYGEFCALKDLNLRIERGEVFGYIGPNGAGKTTTIRILAALMTPSSGRAYVGGTEVTRHPQRIKELVGYLPDFFGVYEGMRVYEYLDFFGAAYKIPRRLRRKRIDEVLETTGSTYMKDKFVEALSRGMKQRIGIARTLIHNPAVLLLDEPLSGLDPKARIEMKELLRKLGELGKTVLVSSHILPELSSISTSVGILDRGRLLVCGRVDEVMRGIRQNRLVEVRLLDNAEGAARLLRGMSEKEQVGAVVRQGDIVRFEWNASEPELTALLGRLVGKGYKVVSFQEVPISLEEAFMELTGDHASAASAAGRLSSAPRDGRP